MISASGNAKSPPTTVRRIATVRAGNSSTASLAATGEPPQIITAIMATVNIDNGGKLTTNLEVIPAGSILPSKQIKRSSAIIMMPMRPFFLLS